MIERNSRRELSLVGDLLLLTRITAGHVRDRARRAPTSPSSRQRRVEAARAGRRQGRGRARRSSSTRPPAIDGDPHRLAQVVDEPGLQRDQVHPARWPGRGQRRSASGERAVLEVTDTGIGIPPEDRGRLFDRMFRARRGRAPPHPGHRPRADDREGDRRRPRRRRSRSTSELGKGTTFRVELPLREAGPARAPDAAARPSGPHGAGRERRMRPTMTEAAMALVLVADDERDIVELVAIVLGRAGYEVVTAARRRARRCELLRERPPPSASSTGGCPGWRASRSCGALREDQRDGRHPGADPDRDRRRGARDPAARGRAGRVHEEAVRGRRRCWRRSSACSNRAMRGRAALVARLPLVPSGRSRSCARRWAPLDSTRARCGARDPRRRRGRARGLSRARRRSASTAATSRTRVTSPSG